MSMLKEFKEFAVQGNVMDMAVGIVIGGAFTPIVNSLVNDVIMPPIGMLLGKVPFKDLYLLLQPGVDGAASYATLEAAKEAGAVTINYGLFINHIISFTILAFAVFMLVKGMNKLRREAKKQEEEDAAEAGAT
jgi:large conductance mechanosensitive channel